MAEKVNRETARAEIERKISIIVAGSKHEFSVWLPRYVADTFRPEEWVDFGIALREAKDELVYKMVANGSYFEKNARAVIYRHIEQSARELIYAEFRNKQEKAGHSAWAVPWTLQGELYKP